MDHRTTATIDQNSIAANRCVVAWLAIALAAACGACGQHDDARREPAAAPEAATFTCYKAGQAGGPFRQCAPTLSDCVTDGCFQRERAYCFPYILVSLTSGEPDRRAMICTPSLRECEEWNHDRKTVVNHSAGPCVLARPDEYLEIK